MKQQSQYRQKHLKFLLYSTKQYIMKMIHQMTNSVIEIEPPKANGEQEIRKQC